MTMIVVKIVIGKMEVPVSHSCYFLSISVEYTRICLQKSPVPDYR